jgi:hypothetical protein
LAHHGVEQGCAEFVGLPTLHREGGFAFKFYASDGAEPPHVHVLGTGGKAKVWLVPSVEVEDVRGYDESQTNRILEVVRQHRDEWLAAWNGFFRDP